MIDIVFLLIIFFVVTARVDKDVVDESITSPKPERTRDRCSRPAIGDYQPGKDGKINVALQPMSISQLQQLLLAMRTQAGSAIPVLIRCDYETQFRHIDRVMQAAASTGLYRVRLIAEATGG